VLLSDVVEVSAGVTATSARNAKIAQIAALLARAEPGQVAVAVAVLSGELLQGQIGVGYATIGDLFRAADAAGAEDGGIAGPLTLTEVNEAFAAIGAVTGPGSVALRRQQLAALFARATDREREFLVRLLAGDLRQGALEGVMTEAVAKAAGVPAEEVRRAHQLGGSLPEVAEAALGGTGQAGTAQATADQELREDAEGQDGTPSPEGALTALRRFALRVGRPARPMLAASAPDVAAALAKISPAAAEWKIDGIRIQVHRGGDEVAVFTRTLDDITARVPEIVEAALSLPVTAAVLDGEAVALAPDGRPRPFQVTAARTASQADVGRMRGQTPLTPLTPRIVTADLAVAEAFFADAVAQGHEGLVLKSLDAPYRAGRRGGEWIKVKPRHTLDLVILAAEWGHGRRRGVLSNLHLGARDPETGGLVMLGKTFKGLTDEMLAWQTARLLDLADSPVQIAADADRRQAYGVVRVRPELVVEVAFDGVQASRRYPGGLALRFARVLRFRPDKKAADADTIDAVRALWAGEP
jgi:DNA ligase-1